MKARERTAMSGLARDCLTHPEHGPSILLQGGVEWCPDSEHSSHRPLATPSILSKQQEALDAAATAARSVADGA
jgi:hypothetical protein